MQAAGHQAGSAEGDGVLCESCKLRCNASGARVENSADGINGRKRRPRMEVRGLMLKRVGFTILIAVVIVGGLGFVKTRQIQSAMKQANFQPPPTAVTTIVAKRENWPATFKAIGSVAAVQGVVVSADLSGIVDKISFDSGRAVREGEVLVQLDTRQERAQLAQAEAQRDLARLNFNRL